MPDTLTLAEVAKEFDSPEGSVEVLHGVTLTVEPGETVAIVGPSGSGKSTLLNIIGSLDKPTSGSVTLGNMDVSALDGKALAEFRSNKVGFVFQDHHLLPQLTALENVMLPTIPAHHSSLRTQHFPLDLLRQMGVDHRAEAFPGTMSGGERQRVAVARALVNGAGLLLCDEPTGSLDRDSGTKIISLLLELSVRQGVAVLMVTHNIEHASRFGRCMELRDGRLVPFTGAEK